MPMGASAASRAVSRKLLMFSATRSLPVGVSSVMAVLEGKFMVGAFEGLVFANYLLFKQV
jgi:hypothetical protein